MPPLPPPQLAGPHRARGERLGARLHYYSKYIEASILYESMVSMYYALGLQSKNRGFQLEDLILGKL